MPRETYEFPIQTQQGVATMSVPLAEFKQCPCGCDLFRALHRVTWVKPSGLIGAAPMMLVANIYVCDGCNRELSPSDKLIGLERARELLKG